MGSECRSLVATCLVLLSLAILQRSVFPLQTSCTERVFQILEDDGSTVLFRENCSSRGLSCDLVRGCVSSSADSQSGFVCPNDISAELRFSELGNCNEYIQCSPAADSDEAPVESTVNCGTGTMFHPELHVCVSGAFFNMTTYCYNGNRNCKNRSQRAGHMYLEPHLTDPRVYIACVDGSILYTGGCQTYFDPLQRECV